MLKIVVNGEERHFEDNIPQNLSQLLSMLKIAEETVVAELDGNIVERKKFSETALRQDCKLELIRFVGGG